MGVWLVNKLIETVTIISARCRLFLIGTARESYTYLCLCLMVLTKRTKTWPNTKPASKEDAETRQERTDTMKRADVDGRKVKHEP